jgi:hypothetical protein
MRKRMLWIAAATLLLLALFGNSTAQLWRRGRPYIIGDPMRAYPRVFLWAWERPEDLSFIDPREAGVVVLAKTLTLDGRRRRLAVRGFGFETEVYIVVPAVTDIGKIEVRAGGHDRPLAIQACGSHRGFNCGGFASG